MSLIPQPKKATYKKVSKTQGTLEITECYPGYGTTLGNALRRVLLSSLEGSAVTAIKIKGVTHEYSVIDGIMEDVVQIVLNMKQLRFRVHSDEPVVLKLSKKGDGVVTTGDIEHDASVDIVDPKQVIATITDKKTQLDMEITVAKGMGYVPIDQQDRGDVELGAIAIDAVYTPLKRVNFNVENMRVGTQTNYEKVTLDIETDGSIDPEEAFYGAVTILQEQFDALNPQKEENEEKEDSPKESEEK